MNLIASIRNRFRSNLSLQLFTIILVVTFILVGSAAWLVHSYVTDLMTTFNHMHLVGAANTIEAALQHTFMLNDMESLQKMFLDLGVQHQANAVRLLGPDSTVLASSNPDEVGISLSLQGATCRSCHAQGLNQIPLTEIQTSDNGLNRVVVVANRVENRIACQECHLDDSQTLGVILIDFPAGLIESWHLPFDIGLPLGSLLVGILITGAIYLPLSRKVLQPLKSLAPPNPQEESIRGEDELQLVRERIDQMQSDLSNSEKTLADQHRKIDTIFSLTYDIDNPPSLEKFFGQSISLIQQVTGYESVTIRLYEPQINSFQIMAQTGMSPAMVNDLKVIPADVGYHAEIAATRKPAYTSDMANDPRLTSDAPLKQGYKSLVCIPLLAQDNLVGTMQIALKYKHIWDQDELRWLALIGRRMGLLIHQIQLTERMRDMAVLEERSRIAQEIHDGLAQLIGSLRLWSDEALTSLEEGKPGAAEKSLQKIETAAREAYASLRDEMLGLRETIFPNKDLLKVITEYLNRFQRQWGIQTELLIGDAPSSRQLWMISPAAEVQLLRIFQEGLTNVRRHADATKISVSLESTEDCFLVMIKDNGHGFDLNRVPDNRLGLRIMRERAASVGGTIRISSVSGKGTLLEISLPLRTAESISRGE